MVPFILLLLIYTPWLGHKTIWNISLFILEFLDALLFQLPGYPLSVTFLKALFHFLLFMIKN
jgi:hypothetical protein